MAAATLLLEAYELAQAARARGDRFVRILVEPKRRYAERYVRLWDSVLGKRIDRHLVAEEQNGVQVLVVDMLVVEVGVADVIEAQRRATVRAHERDRTGPTTIAANQFTRPQRISTAR